MGSDDINILIACEFSGIVRDAFIANGHNAMSCDIEPTERQGPHYQGDVFDIIDDDWDMMIAHPPCTYLAVSGNRWMVDNSERQLFRLHAIHFFMKLANADIPKICIENPVGIMSTKWRKPDQYIQPWEHGHKISKKTGLWLKNLPLLKPTEIVTPEWIYYKNGGRCSPDHYKNAFSKTRGKDRSRTYSGIANAIAKQWE